eukprot:11331370-Ditylum_brightwellii.AAC.1
MDRGLKEVTNLSRISSNKYAGVGRCKFGVCLTDEAVYPAEDGVISLVGGQQSKQDCRMSRGVTSSVRSYLGANVCKLVSMSLLHGKLCIGGADCNDDT